MVSLEKEELIPELYLQSIDFSKSYKIFYFYFYFFLFLMNFAIH